MAGTDALFERGRAAAPGWVSRGRPPGLFFLFWPPPPPPPRPPGGGGGPRSNSASVPAIDQECPGQG
ncbi:hypothetical protein, partial [Nocardia abscessus]|uniref:hypothetical protein n=1 Tax=Nocardia abscessus TaxID=120957 RepID=UPI002454935E